MARCGVVADFLERKWGSNPWRDGAGKWKTCPTPDDIWWRGSHGV